MDPLASAVLPWSAASFKRHKSQPGREIIEAGRERGVRRGEERGEERGERGEERGERGERRRDRNKVRMWMNKPHTERKVSLWWITSGLKIYFSPGRFGCSYRGNSG